MKTWCHDPSMAIDLYWAQATQHRFRGASMRHSLAFHTKTVFRPQLTTTPLFATLPMICLMLEARPALPPAMALRERPEIS